MAGYWIIVSTAGVLLAWAIAFVVAFGVLLAVSLDGAGQLAIRAARSSAPAMWLPPAMLLVAERTPLASGIGFLVIVASVRLLVLNLAQRRVVHLRRHSSKREPFFRHVTTNDGSFSRHTAPVILGALALQSGISVTIAGYPLMASMLAAFGAALWTADLGVEGRVSSIGSDAEATPIVAEYPAHSRFGRVDVVRGGSPCLTEFDGLVAIHGIRNETKRAGREDVSHTARRYEKGHARGQGTRAWSDPPA